MVLYSVACPCLLLFAYEGAYGDLDLFLASWLREPKIETGWIETE